METAKSRIEAKLQEGRLSEPTKAEEKAGQIHPPHKNTKRNLGFEQREVQASSANDNPGRKKKRQQILRVSLGMEKTRKRRQKGGNLRKGKIAGNMMVQPWQRVSKQKVTQTFSPESVISFSPFGEEDGTKGPMIIEVKIGGPLVQKLDFVTHAVF
ncbi:hypothetical protein Tco_1177704 [Tanacetum coccineum]